ncbi:MAG TPA: UPF0182 family protein [Gemmatimonadales bacterium]|nr:UPF0182 family protein [Gemmatimonadales bacterium]
MTRGRRWAFLLGAGLLVVLLVGGHWGALETAERAWATSLPGGASYLLERDWARFVSGFFLFAAIAWGTGNLFFVYRAIGSVQLPRRLGDLEIVEAVPQRLLLVATIASGLLYGILLALGTGDWWMAATLAARAPRFGLIDPVLHRDVGYYVAQLPWAERLHAFALAASVSAVVIVALLYLGMESLRFRRWLPYASVHARSHLGVLLAALALTLTWGALLDPAEAVAGLHGALTRGVLVVRLPAAPFVTALGVVAALASLAWVVREQPTLLAGSWGALVGASVLAYVVLPGLVGGRGAPAAPALAPDARRFEGLAFGVESLAERAPPGFPSAASALAALPVWDPTRVLVAAAPRRDLLGPGARPAAAALRAPPGGLGRATWLVAPRPDLDSLPRIQAPPEWREIHRGVWARAGRPFVAQESDTGLAFAPLATRDSASWFGPAFHEFAVAAPDSWPALGRAGLPLVGTWRRLALAWALQGPELARAETDGLLLLWHRDVRERLERLAPFASFDEPTPLVADGVLWWIAYGYLEAPGFPLARGVVAEGRRVGYLRVGFVGAVSAASGETRLFLAPGADSLAGAWARLFVPLIHPTDSLPVALRAELPYPRRTFRIAVTLLPAWRGDSLAWVAQPREPFEIIAPAPDGEGDERGGAVALWTAQGFEAGDPREVTALVAGVMGPRGPRLFVWRPPPAGRHLPVLVGSPRETAPGVLRLWRAADALFSTQALFAESTTGGPPARIDTIFVTWGERRGQGPTVGAALRDLLAAGSAASAFADTSLAGRWEAARTLAARADAALRAGDLVAFGRYYAQLLELLSRGRRKLAPARDAR